MSREVVTSTKIVYKVPGLTLTITEDDPFAHLWGDADARVLRVPLLRLKELVAEITD